MINMYSLPELSRLLWHMNYHYKPFLKNINMKSKQLLRPQRKKNSPKQEGKE